MAREVWLRLRLTAGRNFNKREGERGRQAKTTCKDEVEATLALRTRLMSGEDAF